MAIATPIPITPLIISRFMLSASSRIVDEKAASSSQAKLLSTILNRSKAQKLRIPH
jgi:hypothetical protein